MLHELFLMLPLLRLKRLSLLLELTLTGAACMHGHPSDEELLQALQPLRSLLLEVRLHEISPTEEDPAEHLLRALDHDHEVLPHCLLFDAVRALLGTLPLGIKSLFRTALQHDFAPSAEHDLDEVWVFDISEQGGSRPHGQLPLHVLCLPNVLLALLLHHFVLSRGLYASEPTRETYLQGGTLDGSRPRHQRRTHLLLAHLPLGLLLLRVLHCAAPCGDHHPDLTHRRARGKAGHHFHDARLH
mmetsp:Transcript_47723/g.102289  ORF Transcript_47723/g.102289 Transcript_47723/m.102289 type:complete len:243 (+) Transcript_47723:1221-1949(+)